ncbi:MAG: methyltransferase domain-containing protein [Thermomicrobiales bacterium]|nr:methyltransferase domain-containing protein [Thermomicrobiales bacterium]
MTAREDVIWQNAAVAANYGVSRTAIPFVDMHFEVMHRLLDAAGLEVRTMLDLGCGDGIVTAEVMRQQPVAHATLQDFSDPFLDAARARFADSQLDTMFVAGDFRETDWHAAIEARGPFDLIASRFAIHHIPHEMKRSLYETVFSWLKPGGMFVQIEHVASATDLYNRAYDKLMVDCLYAARGHEADYDEVYASYRDRADGGANILAPVWDQVEWLREIGFVDCDCAFKCFELSVFAGRKPAENQGSVS